MINPALLVQFHWAREGWRTRTSRLEPARRGSGSGGQIMVAVNYTLRVVSLEAEGSIPFTLTR